MNYEHQGMRLWVEPDERLASGAIEPGSDVTLKIGVEPADASNRVQIRYRVNGGPAAEIAAEPVRHVGNAQYFKAQLPSAALRDGDTMEYSAGCQCAGQRVSSAVGAEEFAASFRVISVAAKGSHAVALRSATRLEVAPAIASRQDMATSDQTVQLYTKQLKPTHLSLFVLEEKTGHPISRMPFYAEVGVTSFLPPAKPECKLEEAILSGLQDFRDTYAVYTRGTETLVEPLCDALSRLLPQETIDRMAGEPTTYAAPIISGILQIAKNLATGKDIDLNDPEKLRKLLEDAIRGYTKEQGLSLAGIDNQEQQIVWAHPLGVLATDHVGYLSFDLTRLPPDVADAVAVALEARRLDPNTPTDTSIWLYPMAREADKIDALAQMRFAHDAIVVKLELDMDLDLDGCQPKLCDSIKNLGIMAMQNPSLTDWRLSAGSFAANSGALVGADGCEMVLPSNIALHEFNFHQVVGVPTAEVGLPIDPAAAGKVRPGFINEYRLSFIPIGHALGQILYSFPLAPGESVNFAVIDWTRRDDAQRKEHTTMDEQLVHNEHRDRTISETVDAAIHEYQHGSSFMAGIAGSAGGAIGGSGMGAAVGLAGSLGGSTSNSSGTRDIAASTVQKLSDNITQASSAMRELHSTVVVHSTQAEHEAIETRTVVNYNHSHALTILYYEVLRHFRVVTEFVCRRPALLTNIHGGIVTAAGAINWLVICENRKLLEAVLLDDRYKEGFDIAERWRHRRDVDHALGLTKEPEPLPPHLIKGTDGVPWPLGPELKFFEFDMRTGGIHAALVEDQIVQVFATLWWKGITLESSASGELRKELNHYGAFCFEFSHNFFVGHVPERTVKDSDGKETKSWTVFAGEIDMIQIHVHMENTNISFEHITVKGVDLYGNRHDLVDKSYDSGHLVLSNDGFIDLPTLRPQPIPPQPGRTAAEIEEDARFLEFNEHLLHHRAHYERVLRLGSTPAQRAFELASLGVGGDASLLEKVDNRPLEVLGDYVAYPCIDPKWSEMIMAAIKKALVNSPEIEPVERLVTLPTRGVFAEAKLGHCNASEEMDPTRFWKWEEHPIPHMAPDIEAIKAGQHLVKDLNLQSTPFPQSMLNIVNPPNAPDPTGLASAMNVLAASNIFRDMSGRAEVADLLKKLSDSSVAIAGVAQKAATGGAGSSGGGAGGSSSGAPQPPTGTSKSVAPPTSTDSQPITPPQQTPEQKQSQQIDNQNKTLQMGNANLNPTQQGLIREKITQDIIKSNKAWNITLTSEWAGETIRQPMEASYYGELRFDSGDSAVLGEQFTNEAATWKVINENTPLSISFLAHEVTPFTGGFVISVPGITVEGFTLKEANYTVPLRGTGKTLIGDFKFTVNKLQVDVKANNLFFHGTGKIGKKDIEVIAEVNSGGELTGEFGRDFQAEGTIEVIKLAISSKLKAAVKTTLGGKAAIKGTFEILYIIGYEVKQL